MFIKDTAGRYQWANRATAVMLDCGRDALIGVTDDAFVSPAEAQRIRAADAEVLAGRGSSCVEQTLRLPDGPRTFRAIKWPYRDAQGQVQGLVSVCRDVTDQRSAERQLRDSERFLRRVIDTSPNCIFVKDAEGRYVLANQSLARMFGAEVDQIIGKTDVECGRRDAEVQRFAEQDQQVIRNGERYVCHEESVVDAVTGETRYFQTTKVPFRVENKSSSGRADEPDEPEARRVLGVATDLTEQKRVEHELRRSESRLQLLSNIATHVTAGMSIDEVIGHTLDQIARVFPDWRIAYADIDAHGMMYVRHSREPRGWPPATGAAMDLTPAPTIIRSFRDGETLVVKEVATDTRIDPLGDVFRQFGVAGLVNVPVAYGEQAEDLGLLCFNTDAPRDWSEHEVAALRIVADYLSVALSDAREQAERRKAEHALRRSEQQMRYQANHDALTGLANRALLLQRLNHTLSRAAEDPQRCFAVLFMDLDRFKVINDSLGHELGDRLLVAVAQRLRDNLRCDDLVSSGIEGACDLTTKDDHVLPARLGGDEFVVLLDRLGDASAAEKIAARVHHALSQPYEVGGHEVTPTASIGIVLGDPAYQHAEDMLRDADTAMYHAKSQGRARHVFFDQPMHHRMLRRLDLERDLREAVEQCAFAVHYQPVLDLERGRVVGAEALLRWPHPTRGEVSTTEVVQLAEELGLINTIGRWAFRQVCQQIRAWDAQGKARSAPYISFNLSCRQLLHPGFVETCAQTIQEAGIDPGRLVLELPETGAMDQLESFLPIMQELRALGVQLCLDDFGAGHSSLTCLHRLPVHRIKIDRTLISHLDQQHEYSAVIQAMLTLAHNLNLRVVAEGVESASELAQLQTLDCDEAQGFYFAEAMRGDDFAALLTNPTALHPDR